LGAAWVFTRSGGVRTQQGSKLVGPGSVGGATHQGWSVAISGDGNTAVVGGPGDDPTSRYGDTPSAGAAWVFTRSGGVWSQQGDKLVGTGTVGGANQGWSVAVSGDGDTAVVGGNGDNYDVGAAWVFTRSAGAWSQQGSKLVDQDTLGPPGQGAAVAISADGDTAIVGASHALSYLGLVYTRAGRVWSQQSKLVGTLGAQSVAISADGNAAVLGAAGAAWVFTRSGAAWTQRGSQLVGAGTVGSCDAAHAQSVAISADGSTVVSGGPWEDCGIGAAWVFTAHAYVGWVPVAIHNPGYNSSRWRSDLGLLNPGAAAANVQITFFGNGGVASSTISVPPQTQSILTDVVGSVLSASGSGAIEVISDQPLEATARSYNQVSPTASCYAGGTQGQDYPVVFTGDGLSGPWGQAALLAGLTENGLTRCNVGLVNTSTGSASVLVELLDGAGTKVADYTVDLVPGQWAQATQPFLNKAGQTALDRGYAKITVQTGFGVFAFASLVDNITNDPTTVAIQRSAPAAAVWVPAASHNGGLNHSQWRSDLGLLNAGVATANVRITFHGTGGDVTKTTQVPPGVQSLLTDVVGQLGGSGSGALEVSSDQPLAATARSYNLVSSSASCYADGTQGQDYPAVVTGDGLTASQSGVLSGLVENASYRCNVGLVNTGATRATVLVELFDGSGTKLAEYPVLLNPGDWKQETRPFLNKAGQTAMDRGYAKVTVQAGSGVFAFASLIDDITNDPTTVAMRR
ncbi:MAG TPA: hypothetical protein VMU14_16130, partial [Acidimicrobiales bacterium]|nr:hypothetical protein [Acidimicrobiales bacterium]